MNRRLLKLASRFDLAQDVLDAREFVFGEPSLSSTDVVVEEAIQNYEIATENHKGYVLFPLLPGYFDQCLRFCVLAHAFRTNGYEPLVLRDSYDLPILPYRPVERRASESGESWHKSEKYRYAARHYPAKFGIETVTIGELLDGTYSVVPESVDSELPASYVHNGHDIADCTAAITRKYFMRYRLDMSDADVRETYTQFLRGSMMLVDAIETLFDRHAIAATVAIEPAYIHGKIPLKVAEAHGAAAYSFSKGYHEGDVLFGSVDEQNYLGKHIPVRVADKIAALSLSESERVQIHELMRARQSGDITPIQYTSNSTSSIDCPESNLIGIFTHLLWDAALEPEQALYEDIYDWLTDTIDGLGDVDDTRFVVKTHPAEAIRGTEESVLDFIDEQYGTLPDNFTVLSPETEVNTYELLDDLDAGIVYASTVGLEMAFEGIPVLVGGYPPYYNAGITHNPTSRAEYREHLAEINRLECTTEMQTIAEQFAYFYFVCKPLQFPYFEQFQSDETETVVVRHDEIASQESVYNQAVTQMLEGDEVLDPVCRDKELS